MSKAHTPTEIKLHQKSKILEISFTSGDNFKLPCEYLRTHARSAEIETAEKPVAGKADVNIERIEPQGNYALRLYFSDGYDTGIFSWDTLHELGSNYDDYWQAYLNRLDKYKLKRRSGEKSEQDKFTVTLLYFMNNLLKVTKKETEQLELPNSVKDVNDLIEMLARRGKDWAKFFNKDALQITVNKQFAEMFTKLENGDEVAFVPISKDI
ncbi:MAG: gamma-butyrobetaine hydroxylase-like domain-containing protein [Gammaproteobacteria bacterium]